MLVFRFYILIFHCKAIQNFGLLSTYIIYSIFIDLQKLLKEFELRNRHEQVPVSFLAGRYWNNMLATEWGL